MGFSSGAQQIMVSQYASPIVLDADQNATVLHRVPLSGSSEETAYNEDWLQKILFEHPETLPIEEIDRSFSGLVPICRELSTPAGPIDVIYATPEGKLVVLEAKLWRNPEARRKVVGQVLDYAKELSRWHYEDLQREVSRRTKMPGNALYHLVAEQNPDIDEAAFVDELSRGLRQGRFLLLICGDGIREGVATIADFLDRHGTLQFSFGLVEMAIYSMPLGGLLVQPRVLAQSAIIKRTVVSLVSDQLTADEDAESLEPAPEMSDLERFYQDFWTEFVTELQLDDVSQPKPNPGRKGNVFLTMTGTRAWITVYFSQSENKVGVFLTFNKGNLADQMYQRLSEEREAIEKELAVPVHWTSEDGKYRIITNKKFSDLRAPENRHSIKEWLADRSNRFVNAFRHRIDRMIDDI